MSNWNNQKLLRQTCLPIFFLVEVFACLEQDVWTIWNISSISSNIVKTSSNKRESKSLLSFHVSFIRYKSVINIGMKSSLFFRVRWLLFSFKRPRPPQAIIHSFLRKPCRKICSAIIRGVRAMPSYMRRAPAAIFATVSSNPFLVRGQIKTQKKRFLNQLLKWSLPFYQRLNFCKTNDDFFMRLIF